MKANLILYVKNQQQSTEFYAKVLNLMPTLNVPGMTEFKLNNECILGLMPELGIKRLLGDCLPNPEQGSGIPRAELYLRVEDPNTYLNRAIKMGATKLSAVEQRDWGDVVAYALDPDGHVIAFAKSA
jgi:uncharacterized glyoxalase superfamily protein PhnB